MEFDGEAFGAEIVAAVKSYVGKELVPVMMQIERLAEEMKNANEWYELAPDDIADEISKAVALLAESLTLHPANQVNPVVVNFSPSSTARKTKTITTRRDDKGNLVARVVEDGD